ncbi:MAG TPA: VOC family protein [Solirubrobacteraceae bacterium]|jgi:catechol 2,3-dioxygenase-like lactoylglutathione lyase family enzyme
MSDTTTANKISGVGTVIVPVSNQDKAIEFYTTKLGFEKRTDVPMGEADRWVEVAAPGSVTTIAIVPPRPGEPCGIQTRVAFTTDDVDGDHAALLSNGVDVDAEIMRHGDPVPPMFFFRDLDNNSFLIVQRS